MAAASHNSLPKSMGMIILVCSVATLLSATTAAARHNPGSIENCVEYLFHPTEPEFVMMRTMCRDLLRSIGISFRIAGILPPEYAKALGKLPKFRDDPAALKKFICSLCPNETALKNYGCQKDDSKN